MLDILSLPNLMPDVQTGRIYTLFVFLQSKLYTPLNVPVNMYMFLKWTASNSTLVTNYLSKYTRKLEFAGVLYQLRFVQPFCLCGFSDLFLAIALAPFTCAAPPSNHHKSCNRNTHIGSTAQPNQFISLNTTQNITPLWGGVLDSLLNTQGRAHTITQ